MCCRFVISSKNAFNLEYEVSYNVCPSQLVPVKTKEKSLLMKWSYSPLWKQDMNLINCRSETMNEKPSFKNSKRCIIFNNGWYEWQRKDNKKIPYYHFSQTNYFAGGTRMASVDLFLHPDDDAYYTTTEETIEEPELDDEGAETGVFTTRTVQRREYTGPTLNVRERLQNLISRMDAIEADEIIDDYNSSALLQLVHNLSARLDLRDQQIADLTQRIQTLELQ